MSRPAPRDNGKGAVQPVGIGADDVAALTAKLPADGARYFADAANQV